MSNELLNRERVLETLRLIKKDLEKQYGITKLGIFGSVARNESTESSDIDIVFDVSVPNIFTTVHLKQDLERKLDRSIDIVRYREKMNPFLKQRIDRDGIYV